MARVTVEDCTKIVPNRFELVLLAAQRARDISAGQEATIERGNDKNAVLALREIALDNVNLDDLRANIVRGVNRHDVDLSEDEKLASLQQARSIEEPVEEDLVDGLSFAELEQEDDEEELEIDESEDDFAISEEDLLASAEDLFAEDDK
jgi:DNA-directed RNA polymerase subunit omega